jgi:hypothetical protein
LQKKEGRRANRLGVAAASRQDWMRGRRRATPRGRDETYAQSKGSGEAGQVKRDGRGGADAGGGAGAADAEYKLGASHPSKSFDHISKTTSSSLASWTSWPRRQRCPRWIFAQDDPSWLSRFNLVRKMFHLGQDVEDVQRLDQDVDSLAQVVSSRPPKTLIFHLYM